MSARESYAVHIEPAWRERANYILNIKLEEVDRFEQLWARKVDDSTFEVCCIPFFAYDLALGDLVSAGENGLVEEVTAASGRYVFRVFFDSSAISHRGRVIDELRAIGALVESYSAKLISVDAENLEHAQRIADQLVSTGARLGTIYETGKS